MEKKNQISIYTMQKDLILMGYKKEAKLIADYHYRYAYPKNERHKSVKKILKELNNTGCVKTSLIIARKKLFDWTITPEGFNFWCAISVTLYNRGL